MSATIDSQRDLTKAIWKICDNFRGPFEAARYKNYILAIFFLKYVSDVCSEQERFVLPEGNNFYDLFNQRDEKNLGELINKSLGLLESQNKEKLDGVFKNIDFNPETSSGNADDRNNKLKWILESFNTTELDFKPSKVSNEVVADTFAEIINKFAINTNNVTEGAFYTPLGLAKLIAKLSKPKAGATACDPTCGTGGLLVELAKTVENGALSLYGMEVNREIWAICRMNMLIHQNDSARIEWSDALITPALVNDEGLMKFDYVIANPPFSLGNWWSEKAKFDQYNRFRRGMPPKNKGDYAFISHMIEAAVDKKGKVVVVASQGVLFRGASEGSIRQKLIEENLLDAVINLPSNLLHSTSIPLVILVFNRSREHGGPNANKKTVLFIDASKDLISEKSQDHLSESQISKIVKTYEQWEAVDRYSHIASFDEIKANEFNLNVSRYIDTYQKKTIDIAEVQTDIEQLEAELIEVRAKIEETLRKLGNIAL
jgi:type I restriction enzyme M protein